MTKRKKHSVSVSRDTSKGEDRKDGMQVKRNLVAKFAKTYNKAHCHLDKKAAFKRGKVKHKQHLKMFDRLKESHLIYLFA